MLILIGAVTGLVTGVWATCLWGLRKADAIGPRVAELGLALVPVVVFWGGDLFGWPTPGSIASSSGAVDGVADSLLIVGIAAVAGGVAVAVLVKSGVLRRLETWADKPG